MNLTETKLKQLIKEELTDMMSESKGIIPTGPKAMEQVEKMLTNKLGPDYSIVSAHRPRRPRWSVWEMYWSITIKQRIIKSKIGPGTRSRGDEYAVHITRAKQYVENRQALIIGGEIEQELKDFPATWAALSSEDPNGFWHWLGAFLETLVGAEEQAMDQDDPGEELPAANPEEAPIR